MDSNQPLTRRQGGVHAWLAWLLRSPLHILLDSGTLLITVFGRKTGIAYTTPVNYVRDREALIVLSRNDRTWWKNARAGARVYVHMRGRDFGAQAETIEDPAAVAATIQDLFQRLPAFRARFRVRLGRDGAPAADRAAWLARNRVIVRIMGLAPATDA